MTPHSATRNRRGESIRPFAHYGGAGRGSRTAGKSSARCAAMMICAPARAARSTARKNFCACRGRQTVARLVQQEQLRFGRERAGQQRQPRFAEGESAPAPPRQSPRAQIAQGRAGARKFRVRGRSQEADGGLKTRGDNFDHGSIGGVMMLERGRNPAHPAARGGQRQGDFVATKSF